MTTLVINLQSRAASWEADRPTRVEKCTQCGTCYPERYLTLADLRDGVCVECRGGERHE